MSLEDVKEIDRSLVLEFWLDDRCLRHQVLGSMPSCLA